MRAHLKVNARQEEGCHMKLLIERYIFQSSRLISNALMLARRIKLYNRNRVSEGCSGHQPQIRNLRGSQYQVARTSAVGMRA